MGSKLQITDRCSANIRQMGILRRENIRYIWQFQKNYLKSYIWWKSRITGL